MAQSRVSTGTLSSVPEQVSLSYATPYYRLEAEPAIFETAVRALAEQ